MHLSPREIDKLLLHNAGCVAQKRLARGLRLNHPEAVALIATQLLEFIREGRSVAELMNLGSQLLGRNQVMSGVPGDRKSTRLNSSHITISYAVFCLKKKKNSYTRAIYEQTKTLPYNSTS